LKLEGHKTDHVLLSVIFVHAVSDSSVSIATRYGLDGPVIESRLEGARFSVCVAACVAFIRRFRVFCVCVCVGACVVECVAACVAFIKRFRVFCVPVRGFVRG